MIAYKVVAQPELGEYYSLIYHTEHNNPFALRYTLNTRVVPKIGKLFVYIDLPDAVHHVHSVTNGAIIQGEAEDLSPICGQQQVISILAIDNDPQVIDLFWRCGDKTHVYTTPPNGSHFCSAFTPRKVLVI